MMFERRTLVSVQEGLGRDQERIAAPGTSLAHGFANGFLQGLALAINEPEYALALWLDQARHMADEAFFRSFHADEARMVVERWPLEVR